MTLTHLNMAKVKTAKGRLNSPSSSISGGRTIMQYLRAFFAAARATLGAAINTTGHHVKETASTYDHAEADRPQRISNHELNSSVISRIFPNQLRYLSYLKGAFRIVRMHVVGSRRITAIFTALTTCYLYLRTDVDILIAISNCNHELYHPDADAEESCILLSQSIRLKPTTTLFVMDSSQTPNHENDQLNPSNEMYLYDFMSGAFDSSSNHKNPHGCQMAEEGERVFHYGTYFSEMQRNATYFSGAFSYIDEKFQNCHLYRKGRPDLFERFFQIDYARFRRLYAYVYWSCLPAEPIRLKRPELSEIYLNRYIRPQNYRYPSQDADVLMTDIDVTRKHEILASLMNDLNPSISRTDSHCNILSVRFDRYKDPLLESYLAYDLPCTPEDALASSLLSDSTAFSHRFSAVSLNHLRRVFRRVTADTDSAGMVALHVEHQITPNAYYYNETDLDPIRIC